MKSRQTMASRLMTGVLGLFLSLLVGCTCSGSRVDQALQAGHGISTNPLYAEQNYQVHCPDELEIRVGVARPEVEQCTVGPDGKIRRANGQVLSVEGLKPGEIGQAIARLEHKNPGEISVRVTHYQSQQVFLFGEVPGLQRAIEFHGPETVTELLQRVGGLTAQAAPGDVQIVRSHVAAGRPPEVFDVNLAAIVLQKDNQTNVRILPFDQLYIGETPQGHLCRCLPPWLRPFFQRLYGMKEKKELATSTSTTTILQEPTGSNLVNSQ